MKWPRQCQGFWGTTEEVTLGGGVRDGQTRHVGDFLIGGTASAKALWCEWTHPVRESPTTSVGSEQTGEGRGQKVVENGLSIGSQSQLHVRIKTTTLLWSSLPLFASSLPGESNMHRGGGPTRRPREAAPRRGSEGRGTRWALGAGAGTGPSLGFRLRLRRGAAPAATSRARPSSGRHRMPTLAWQGLPPCK